MKPIKPEKRAVLFILAAFILTLTQSPAANYPAPDSGDFIIRDFKFHSGETLPELRMHYLTFGRPVRDQQGVVRNAVLILHGTGGSSGQFLRSDFADQLYGTNQPLDVSKYYLIIPDNLGHGRSSKPSDGLRAKFPKYGYRDMVAAQYRLVTEGLKVNRLRLVMGTSMGGMHTWLWGQTYPDFMDALMPLGSLPAQISARNRAWRRLIIDAIRNDPEWRNGEYESQPPSVRTAAQMSWFMGSNPVLRLKATPTLKQTDQLLDQYLSTNSLTRLDANNMLYWYSASEDYDPGPGLEKIQAPLLAINSADDLINPPELRILETEIKRVRRGKAIVLPYTAETVGHGSHTKAVLWKKHLTKLLKKTEP